MRQVQYYYQLISEAYSTRCPSFIITHAHTVESISSMFSELTLCVAAVITGHAEAAFRYHTLFVQNDF